MISQNGSFTFTGKALNQIKSQDIQGLKIKVLLPLHKQQTAKLT